MPKNKSVPKYERAHIFVFEFLSTLLLLRQRNEPANLAVRLVAKRAICKKIETAKYVSELTHLAVSIFLRISLPYTKKSNGFPLLSIC